MFGITNIGGSCWINACLQGLFTIPQVKDRYSSSTELQNNLDSCLKNIWSSRASISSLAALFPEITTKTTPAGRGIGDSHELFVIMCDKLPFLDNLCSFETANVIKCSCGNQSIHKHKSNNLFIHTSGKLTDSILASTNPEKIDSYSDCSICSATTKTVSGCVNRFIMCTFPDLLVINILPNTNVQFGSEITLNQNKYELISVICNSGGHWFGYYNHGKWMLGDDTNVTETGVNIRSHVRVLFYIKKT